MSSDKIENVLVLQGGGLLGAFGCGVYKALVSNNIKLDIVAGTSIGGANSQGIYSAVNDLGTTGKKFLRGYQLTDNNGTVRFTTIYPGWYEGRTIHIHDKVRTFNGLEKTIEWTSQIYFDDSINQQVHTELPYSNHGPPQTSNEEDGIYTGPSTDGLMQRNSGDELMVHLIKEGHSFRGTFNIVLYSGQPKQ